MQTNFIERRKDKHPMTKYTIKPGKIGTRLIGAYKKVEQSFTEKFLEEDETNQSGYTVKPGKIQNNVVDGYKKIENGVVDGYKSMATGVVGRYKKIENKFIEKYLDPIDTDDQEAESEQEAES